MTKLARLVAKIYQVAQFLNRFVGQATPTTGDESSTRASEEPLGTPAPSVKPRGTTGQKGTPTTPKPTGRSKNG